MGDPGRAVLTDALKRALEANEHELKDPEHERLRMGVHTLLLIAQDEYSSSRRIGLRQVILWGTAAGAFISGLVQGLVAISKP